MTNDAFHPLHLVENFNYTILFVNNTVIINYVVYVQINDIYNIMILCLSSVKPFFSDLTKSNLMGTP